MPPHGLGAQETDAHPPRIERPELRAAVELEPVDEYAEQLLHDRPPIPPEMTIEEIRAARRGAR